MSVGIGGACVKFGENDSAVMYEYYAYHPDNKACCAREHVYNGQIKIEKSAFADAKADLRNAPCMEDWKADKVSLNNLSSGSHIYDGYGFVGFRLICKIFREYRHTGMIPHAVSVNS